ncbi:phosphonatase-like hydrolase [Streptomyces tubbatahanensis]|uniref:Phosphonatase-like hydrolase n=1 Tax=Streptomyces tubbatahanensis TaxID=2923272 RepID=A0ABY3XLE4_9ACTN|nr:phosphonatase-like hydrolase [Streptomyces tubbatahanensis]UNS95223.1 phosphonatase-like hydrolase [Streptomyces tubbatahanensis]
MTTLSLAVLDLAGTTVADDGIVEDAFLHALSREGVRPGSARHDAMMRHIRDTMGESKVSVFRHLFDGDEDTAQRANTAFEEAYAQMVASGRCSALPGARQTIESLRAHGCAVVLNTGFSPRTRDDLLASLGWSALADAVLSPADAGRGRPYPDMVLTALLRTGAPSVDSVAVVGDTPHDMRAGRAAGAGLVAGVLTGGHDARSLRAAGADQVLDSVAGLPALIEAAGRAA